MIIRQPWQQLRTIAVRNDWQDDRMRDTANRLLRLLTLLQSRSQWTSAQVAERLEVTERTVRRDVDRLRELGYPIDATSGVGGGYRLGRGKALPPLVLDDEEAVAVAVSLRIAAGGTVAGIDDSAMRALAKLEQLLPNRLRVRISALHSATESMAAGTPTVDPSVLLELAQACRDRMRVGFGYESHQGKRSLRRVEPHRLVSTGRRWYLVARDLDRDAWRSFRVDRLDSVTSSGPRFVLTDPPDAVEFVTRGVATAPYRFQARVRLHMTPERAAEWVAPSTGIVTPLDDGSCELTTGADSLSAIALSLAVFGCDFEVLEPTELMGAVRALAERLLRAASDRPS
jgi:predicted DNA-binding transcriptional regulator YafY